MTFHGGKHLQASFDAVRGHTIAIGAEISAEQHGFRGQAAGGAR